MKLFGACALAVSLPDQDSSFKVFLVCLAMDFYLLLGVSAKLATIYPYQENFSPLVRRSVDVSNRELMSTKSQRTRPFWRSEFLAQNEARKRYLKQTQYSTACGAHGQWLWHSSVCCQVSTTHNIVMLEF